MKWAAVFLVLGLVALLVTGLLGRSALEATPSMRGEAVPASTVPLRQQPEQIKRAVEDLMQQPRPMPDDVR